MFTRSICLILLLATLPGMAAKLDFVGLQSFTKKGLLEAVGGRLDYILDRPATDFRADDAAFLVESYLRTHGLVDAMVYGQKLPDNRIRLTVEEGIAQFLGAITVKGFDDKASIQDQFKAPFPETGDRRAYEAEATEEGLERVRDLLHTDGYWEGTVAATKGTRQANGDIPFTLIVNAGPVFTLEKPELKSRVPPSPSLLKDLIANKGNKATAENIVAIRQKITEDFRRRGYPDIFLIMLKETKDNRLTLTFLITPGKKFVVRSFQSAGLKKTRPQNVSNRFKGLVGKNFDEKFVHEEIKKLLATGAFSSVRLEKTEVNETELDLTLHLEEAEARGYSVSMGYGSIEGYIVGLRYFDRNLWGRLWNLSAGAEFTGLGGLGEISLTDPSFLDGDLSLSSRAFLISRDFNNYNKLEGGLGSELTWKWGKHYTGTAGLTVSRTTIDSPIPDNLIGSDGYLVSRVSLRQVFDWRDDPALPSKGWFASLETSIGLSSGDESVGFTEVEGQISYYRSLGKNTSYALGLRGGFISPSVDDQRLPIDLRKFLGGANTIRSFPELEMGPSFNGLALGGTKWWLANAEYMHTLVGPVRGLVFIDAAGLDSEVELAAGVGVRINLPVGPIRFEYGRSLSQDSGEPGGAFHFAIGTTF